MQAIERRGKDCVPLEAPLGGEKEQYGNEGTDVAAPVEDLV